MKRSGAGCAEVSAELRDPGAGAPGDLSCRRSSCLTLQYLIYRVLGALVPYIVGKWGFRELLLDPKACAVISSSQYRLAGAYCIQP